MHNLGPGHPQNPEPDPRFSHPELSDPREVQEPDQVTLERLWNFLAMQAVGSRVSYKDDRDISTRELTWPGGDHIGAVLVTTFARYDVQASTDPAQRLQSAVIYQGPNNPYEEPTPLRSPVYRLVRAADDIIHITSLPAHSIYPFQGIKPDELDTPKAQARLRANEERIAREDEARDAERSLGLDRIYEKEVQDILTFLAETLRLAPPEPDNTPKEKLTEAAGSYLRARSHEHPRLVRTHISDTIRLAELFAMGRMSIEIDARDVQAAWEIILAKELAAQTEQKNEDTLRFARLQEEQAQLAETTTKGTPKEERRQHFQWPLGWLIRKLLG